ncbi:MAG: hypothetical protein EDM05_037250 [Leptolyngbya sp. IPPAS B-1204]|uniref:Antifreeze protein n=1 Tax=Leptolyngbya sp. NK1-12 TaxID=2547451 RepID=A0AA97AQQ7_9CYAN|nr:hypothetical protein [Leptolyngbya sp. NK1-12]MBF2047763.1 hypothetical protein [Elainella sp. C42_A2020_010]RNJ68952.1 MAG: hypothetical protein EDM05_12050 [Leptolyngbya sp. IPPAS B-1204]WNZ24003.1 hypothetical protein HJG54_14820 [Leptolyngbya sp. NK1-12]
MKSMNRIVITACALLATSAVMDQVFNSGMVIREAAAIVGRPATPVSGAGVARRTTRRVIRRSTIYAAALPAGCSTVVIEGTSLYRCGATYYQPYGNQYVVVYID